MNQAPATTLSTKRKPYSILMSEAERRRAEQLAAIIGVTVPELIRLAIDSDNLEKTLLNIKKKHLDRKEAAQILAVLGKTRVFANLNQLVKSIHTGAFSTQNPDTDTQLEELIDVILWLRATLIKMQELKP